MVLVTYCIAGMASTALLPSITNHQVACKLLLTGDLISAQVSKQICLDKVRAAFSPPETVRL